VRRWRWGVRKAFQRGDRGAQIPRESEEQRDADQPDSFPLPLAPHGPALLQTGLYLKGWHGLCICLLVLVALGFELRALLARQKLHQLFFLTFFFVLVIFELGFFTFCLA
jgi:hypothetical protein